MPDIDLKDERFYRRRIPWDSLAEDGYEPKIVMLEAQKKKMWTLARKAEHRWHNQKVSK